MKKSTAYLVQGALIAAMYATATYLSSAFNLAYGPIQFRLSEALTVLALFTPAAIPGLTVGCVIGNLGSPYGVIDIVLGSSATLIAALMTRATRNVKIKEIPFTAPLWPVLANCVIVGAEITVMSPEGASLIGFLSAALSVGIGEAAVCFGLGLPLALTLEKTGVAQKYLTAQR